MNMDIKYNKRCDIYTIIVDGKQKSWSGEYYKRMMKSLREAGSVDEFMKDFILENDLSEETEKWWKGFAEHVKRQVISIEKDLLDSITEEW